jgi:3',5'-cyclic AMP phosphodiesterase CpdA
MTSSEVIYPRFAKDRGVRYWLRPGNLWAARFKFMRRDHSNDWRRKFEQAGPTVHPSRSVPFSRLLPSGGQTTKFRFLILGDTGEGDRSQYGLLPLIRSLDPDFMVINGDLAYPAGRHDDFVDGFFEPYRNLGIPIWAVPGNHEYYSPNDGQEFFEIFCTEKWGQLWADHGLVLRPQPGTYWELREPFAQTSLDKRMPLGHPPLALIGLDSGKAGNLDRDDSGSADDRQYNWLESRLRAAERDGFKVIVLFHIPALVNGKNEPKLGLGRLHQILASSKNVRLVVCGHIHNSQQYEPAVFAKYLQDVHKATPQGPIDYIVSGGGGASLGSPIFEGPYKASTFPTPADWKANIKRTKKILSWAPLAESSLGKLAITAYEDAEGDEDAAKWLSFLLVDVDNGAVKVTPVFMEDIAKLFPSGQRIEITNPATRVGPVEQATCLQTPPIIL